MTIRQATPSDYDAIAELFTNTILQVNIRDYSDEQVKVWSSRVKDRPRWLAKIRDQYFLLAEEGKTLLGMGSITPGGYLDILFVSHLHQGKGVARRLMEQLEHYARQQDLKQIRSDVSITARPFFEGMGFSLVRPQQVKIEGMIFDNFVMKKWIGYDL
ncbi:MAG: GNAT family N-acetyltransferase [Lewinella sp.]|nr:GNAT family N-acetyltransferase [Lewinella sp.]